MGLLVVWEQSLGGQAEDVGESLPAWKIRLVRGLGRRFVFYVDLLNDSQRREERVARAIAEGFRVSLKVGGVTLASDLKLVGQRNPVSPNHTGELVFESSSDTLATGLTEPKSAARMAGHWGEAFQSFGLGISSPGLQDLLQAAPLVDANLAKDLNVPAGAAAPLIQYQCSNFDFAKRWAQFLSHQPSFRKQGIQLGLLVTESARVAVGSPAHANELPNESPLKVLHSRGRRPALKPCVPICDEFSLTPAAPTGIEAVYTRGGIGELTDDCWKGWRETPLPFTAPEGLFPGADPTAHQLWDEFELTENRSTVVWRTRLVQFSSPMIVAPFQATAWSDLLVVKCHQEDDESGFWLQLTAGSGHEFSAEKDFSARARHLTWYGGEDNENGANFPPEPGAPVKVSWNGVPGRPLICEGDVRIRKPQTEPGSFTTQRPIKIECQNSDVTVAEEMNLQAGGPSELLADSVTLTDGRATFQLDGGRAKIYER